MCKLNCRILTSFVSYLSCNSSVIACNAKDWRYLARGADVMEGTMSITAILIGPFKQIIEAGRWYFSADERREAVAQRIKAFKERAKPKQFPKALLRYMKKTTPPEA